MHQIEGSGTGSGVKQSGETPAPEGRLRRFAKGIRDLYGKHPLLSGLGTLLLFAVGWSAEAGLDRVLDAWFPSASAVRAQQLREEIDVKTDTISRMLARMEGQVEDLAGDAPAASELRETAEAILRELGDLRPSIAAFSDEAGRLTARFMSAKASELAQGGQSAAADFTIAQDAGVTICPARFTVGTQHSSAPQEIRVTISQSGSSESDSLGAGETVRLDSGAHAAVVDYLGPTADGDLHRFNFACLALDHDDS